MAKGQQIPSAAWIKRFQQAAKDEKQPSGRMKWTAGKFSPFLHAAKITEEEMPLIFNNIAEDVQGDDDKLLSWKLLACTSGTQRDSSSTRTTLNVPR
jgi:hypothetical protein